VETLLTECRKIQVSRIQESEFRIFECPRRSHPLKVAFDVLGERFVRERLLVNLQP
jgi:hypothetical protein